MSDSLETPRSIAHQAPRSVGFPRQEYWSGLPFPSPVYLPNPGIEPISPALAGRFFLPLSHQGSPLNIKTFIKVEKSHHIQRCRKGNHIPDKNLRQGFPGGSVVKNLPASAGDTSSIPGPGGSHMPQATKPTCHNY